MVRKQSGSSSPSSPLSHAPRGCTLGPSRQTASLPAQDWGGSSILPPCAHACQQDRQALKSEIELCGAELGKRVPSQLSGKGRIASAGAHSSMGSGLADASWLDVGDAVHPPAHDRRALFCDHIVSRASSLISGAWLHRARKAGSQPDMVSVGGHRTPVSLLVVWSLQGI